jgi:hypothetical protein
VRSRKLLALAILPLALLMVVPVVVPISTTHAQTANYEIQVSCDASAHQSDVATLVFLGHSLVVSCPAGNGYHEKSFFFSSGATGTYYAQLIAGGQYQFQLGSFGPTSCFVEGEQYGSGYSSWAYFDIYTGICE